MLQWCATVAFAHKIIRNRRPGYIPTQSLLFYRKSNRAIIYIGYTSSLVQLPLLLPQPLLPVSCCIMDPSSLPSPQSTSIAAQEAFQSRFNLDDPAAAIHSYAEYEIYRGHHLPRVLTDASDLCANSPSNRWIAPPARPTAEVQTTASVLWLRCRQGRASTAPTATTASPVVLDLA